MSIRILVCETDRIGDVILCLPVISAIRKKYPEAFIGILISPYTFDIVKRNPDINCVIQLENNTLAEIKKNKFDIALILHPSISAVSLVFGSGIPVRIMNGFKWYQFMCNRIIDQHRSRIEKHQALYNLELAAMFLNTPVDVKELKIELDKKDIDFADRFFKQSGLSGKKVIGIHPGSGGSSLNLPFERYLEIIEWVSKNTKAKILITGSEEEISRVKNKGVVKIPFKISLGQLCAIISKLNLFISNSTGPMHIATAFKVKVISFFSPVHVQSPVRWGPFTGNNLVLLPEIDCREYWHCEEKCKEYNCMVKFDLQKVYNFIKENL